jgi:aspartate kinase
MITTSEVAVSVTIDNDQFLNEIVQELAPFGTVDVLKNQTIVSIVGNEIAQTKNVLQKIFDSLKNVPVTMVSYGGSPHNISLLVPADQKVNTLQLLNSGLFGL